ncbi:[Protein ADP-ribosylarginine] hydrolase [Holothuria leucospilota]|uniref:[Protein ADP-ribosylarginine] hydrolase n=1 Tax=Holothuria leucospilota TaxID=206669 RepID=A0A9Q0YPA1_HOLLE|nr:[Protein ADP-ribosylarginine] hydrolase [Holothuria leucospilota]
MSLESFQAALVLSAAGNCIGQHSSTCDVLEHKIIDGSTPVQESIVLHLATAEALAKGKCGQQFLQEFATNCSECMASDMQRRVVSNIVLQRTSELQPSHHSTLFAPFNHGAVDNCASIRALVIGLRYHKPNHVDELIASVIESTRMIHHHPISYLGALTTALFASFAVQEREPREWGAGLMAALRLALEYIVSDGRNVSESGQEWQQFEDRWKEYLALRGILEGEKRPKFPKKFKKKEERDEFCRRFSLPRMESGSCSHDAPLIAV